MTVIYQYPLTTDFLGVRSLQANGTNPTGDSSPAGNGQQISIVDGWARFKIWPTDAPFGGNIRAELTGPDETVPSLRMYRWESRFGDDWVYDPENFVVMQMHANHPGTAYAEEIIIRCNGRNVWLDIPAAEPPATGLTSKSVASFPFESGVVYKHALIIKWDKTGKGSILWIVNGVVLYSAPLIGTEYNYPVGPYFKVGVYTGGTHLNQWVTRTQYVRNVIVTDGLDGKSWTELIGAVPTQVPFAVEP